MRKSVVCFLTLSFLLACTDQSVSPDNTPNLRALSSGEVTVSSSVNDFGFELLRKVQDGQNTFISPLSVSLALGMVLNGASDNTRQSIINTINFEGLTADDVNQAYKDLTALLLSMDRTVDVGLANSVWSHQDYPVNPTFTDIIKNYYGGKVQALDFRDPATTATINNWVESETNGRIKNLIDGISGDEVMFLINTIYFKGQWKYQFDASKTHSANFHREDGTTAAVKMMFSKGSKILYGTQDGVQLLDVPYGNGQFNMTILVPSTGTTGDLIQSLTSSQLQGWLTQADTLTTELEIPKFKMTWKQDLKDPLMAMGMKMEDFPKLFAEPLPLAISRVIHQSFLEVNETGSEAAAATAIGVVLTSLPSRPPRITIDKPFVFFIREKHSGMILFSGRLVDPVTLQ